MKKRLRVIGPLLLIVIVAAVILTRRLNGHDAGTIMVSGNIEVTEAQLGFKIPGILQKRPADEGDRVRQGQDLAKLDPTDQQLAAAQARANLDLAQAVLAELLAGSRPEEIQRAQARVRQAQYSLDALRKGSRNQEIQAAQAELEQAKAMVKTARAQLEQAREDFQRFSELVKSDNVSRRDYEQVRTRYETAQNTEHEALAREKRARENLSLRKEGARQEDIQQAEAILAQAEAGFALVKAGPRSETIDQARAKVQIAKQALALARRQVQNTVLQAPMDGIVLAKSAEPGEYLNPGSPVISLGDLQNPWVRAYITETDLGRIRLGDPAQVTVDAFKDKVFKGRVSYIAGQAEFTPKTVQTFEERTRLMYRIKIQVENPDGELKPGMPADARIRTGD